MNSIFQSPVLTSFIRRVGALRAPPQSSARIRGRARHGHVGRRWGGGGVRAGLIRRRRDVGQMWLLGACKWHGNIIVVIRQTARDQYARLSSQYAFIYLPRRPVTNAQANKDWNNS